MNGYDTPIWSGDDSGNNNFAGDPINTAIGNVVESARDYRGSGPFPVNFSRTYNSLPTLVPGIVNSLGGNWRGTYDANIVTHDGDIYVYRPDGKAAKFSLVNGAYASASDVVATLTPVQANGQPAGWVYTTAIYTVETYDVNGLLKSIANRNGLVQTLAYDGNGLLSSVTDPFGRVLQFAYDASSRLVTLTGPDFTTIQYTYDANNNLISVTYPDSTTTGYQYQNSAFPSLLTSRIDAEGVIVSTWVYDSQGRAIGNQLANGVAAITVLYNQDSTDVTDVRGVTRTRQFLRIGSSKKFVSMTVACSDCDTGLTRTVSYDSNGFETGSTDFSGLTIQNTRDSRGLVLTKTIAVGTPLARTINYTWHPIFQKLTSIVLPNNQNSQFEYDDKGNLTKRTMTADGVSRVSTYQYNAIGQLIQVTNPGADGKNVTTLTYDAQGNRASVTNALNQSVLFTQYDANGRLLSLTDARGRSTSFTYDVRGRLLSQDTAGSVITFNYNATGNITQIRQNNGQILNYTYDSAHRPTGYSDTRGNSIVYTLDAAGNKIHENIYDPNNQLSRTHSYIYDELNRLRIDIGADNQTANLDYDTNGNLTDQTDPKGNPTSYAFDSLNRLIDTTDANNGQTSYSYDDRDNLTSVADANGNTTTYSYDAFDNLIEQNSPDTGLSTFNYDQANNRLSKTDARGRLTSYQYDVINRLTHVNYADTSLNINYYYDNYAQNDNYPDQHGIGRLTGQTDNSGTTDYYYDIRGNLSHQLIQRGEQTYSLNYLYNNTDQLTQIIYPDGRTVDYSYDTVGNISQVTTTDDLATTQSILNSMHYQAFGPTTSQTVGNGITTSQINDLNYRNAQLVTPNILERTYDFDANSNIISITDWLEANNNQQFDYDKLNRLTDANSASYGDIYYQYDSVHNRTNKATLYNSLTQQQGTVYDTESNQIVSIINNTVKTYHYDANGNITDDGRYQFSYGDDNRLHSVRQNGSTIANYSYNAQGQRSLKKAGNTTTYYFYSPSGQLLTEIDSLGNTQKNYLYANGQLVAIAHTGATTTAQELILDNLDASYSDNWPLSTSVQGYTNSNYQYHAKSSGSTSTADVGTPIDNLQATYSDNWPLSTSVNQYYGTNYQYHAPSSSTTTDTLGTPIDNLQANYVGTWPLSTSVAHYYASNYQYNAAGTGANTATWTSNISTTASYDVYAYWTAAANRASNAQYTIYHTSGNDTVTANQKENGGQWNLLGTYTMDTASTIVLSDNADGYVIADGVTIVPAGTQPNTTIQAETATWPLNVPSTASYDVYAHWAAAPNRASDAKYTINHSNGSNTVTVNQQQNGGQWNLLGTYTLDTTSTAELSSDANGYVIADGMTILPAGTPPDPTAPTYEIATWTPNQAGSYEVYARWTAASNRATDAKYTISHTAGSDTITVNQRQNGSGWRLLGTYTLDATSSITLNDDADGYVIADGLKLTPITTTTTTNGLYYVHNDHLGTPQTITDQQQQIVWQANFDPFGKATLLVNTLENNVRFPGHYFDVETSLDYNYFRYYDPEVGRYITSDPIGLAGGINTCSYVSSNPLSNVDPTGLDVTVALYPGALSAGHVGIGVNSSSTTGFYPSPGSSSLSLAFSQTVPGALLPDIRTPIVTIIIPATPAQDKAIQDFIYVGRFFPGNYNLYGKDDGENCATTVRDALGVAGINTPSTIYPREILKNLQQKFILGR